MFNYEHQGVGVKLRAEVQLKYTVELVQTKHYINLYNLFANKPITYSL